MTSDIICINDKFTPDQLEFYKIWGVTIPKQDNLYTIREFITHSMAGTGIRLNEIINPEVPINHPILGTIMYEVTFSKDRFTDLNGLPLIEIKESTKKQSVELNTIDIDNINLKTI